jgi:Protein of unknown function (DUF2924)
MFGRTPPAALSKDLLGRLMAWRLQEQAFGDLDRESLRFLNGLARYSGSPRRQLKPGTVLVRDYHGQRHTVTVAADGFNWQGTTYASLSAIARAVADVFFFNRKSSAVKWSQGAAGFKLFCIVSSLRSAYRLPASITRRQAELSRRSFVLRQSAIA